MPKSKTNEFTLALGVLAVVFDCFLDSAKNLLWGLRTFRQMLYLMSEILLFCTDIESSLSILGETLFLDTLGASRS